MTPLEKAFTLGLVIGVLIGVLITLITMALPYGVVL